MTHSLLASILKEKAKTREGRLTEYSNREEGKTALDIRQLAHLLKGTRSPLRMSTASSPSIVPRPRISASA